MAGLSFRKRTILVDLPVPCHHIDDMARAMGPSRIGKIMQMKMHVSITADRVAEAVERGLTSLDNPGFCILCGADADGCEPDARKYKCDYCDQHGVYGAEELLLMLV